MKRLLMFIITVTAILVLFTPYSEAHADENDDYCELDEIKIASDEIDIDELKKYKTIGIASASSTPIQQVELVLNYLRKNA